MTSFTSLFTPGTLLTHPGKPDWGIGQVQSNIDGRITVNFQNAGKQVIDATRIDLIPMFPDQEQHK